MKFERGTWRGRGPTQCLNLGLWQHYCGMGWDGTTPNPKAFFLSLPRWSLQFKTARVAASKFPKLSAGCPLGNCVSIDPSNITHPCPVSQVGLQLLCSQQRLPASLVLWNPTCPMHGVPCLLLRGGTAPRLLPETGMEKSWEAKKGKVASLTSPSSPDRWSRECVKGTGEPSRSTAQCGVCSMSREQGDDLSCLAQLQRYLAASEHTLPSSASTPGQEQLWHGDGRAVQWKEKVAVTSLEAHQGLWELQAFRSHGKIG